MQNKRYWLKGSLWGFIAAIFIICFNQYFSLNLITYFFPGGEKFSDMIFHFACLNSQREGWCGFVEVLATFLLFYIIFGAIIGWIYGGVKDRSKGLIIK